MSDDYQQRIINNYNNVFQENNGNVGNGGMNGGNHNLNQGNVHVNKPIIMENVNLPGLGNVQLGSNGNNNRVHVNNNGNDRNVRKNSVENLNRPSSNSSRRPKLSNIDMQESSKKRKRKKTIDDSDYDSNDSDDSDDDDDDEDYENEHKGLEGVSVCIGREEMIKVLGSGVVYYFTYIKFLVLLNLVLTLIGLINYIPHMVEDTSLADESLFGTMNIASYQYRQVDGWTVSCILSVVCLFFGGYFYKRYITKVQAGRADGTAIDDPFEGLYGIDSDDAVDKVPYDVPLSSGQQYFRRVISVCIFVIALGLQGVINYGVNLALEDSGEGLIATILSLVVTIVGIIWKPICKKLTAFEHHKFYSTMRRWDLFKVFLFKIFNVLVLYAVKIPPPYDASLPDADPADSCIYRAYGVQFLNLIIVDITTSNVIEVVVPAIKSCTAKSKAKKTQKADADSKPEFILSDEYVEVLYRQFIVSLGIFMVPMIGVVALFGNFLEYWLDKFRMIKICQKPKRTNADYKNVLFFFTTLISLVALFGYPNGLIWVLSGEKDPINYCLINKDANTGILSQP